MPDRTTPVTGPHPIHITAIPGGANLDITAYLRNAIHDALDLLTGELLEDFDRAVEQTPCDPHKVERPEDLPFERLVNTLVERVGAPLPVYGQQVAKLADALHQIARPKGLPGQREAGAA
jgi:hypothetical protein